MARALTELLPDVAARAAELLAAAAQADLRIQVNETYRSFARQAELHAQGRSTPGPIVTNALPGFSWHQWRRALDVVFQGPNPWGADHPWAELGELGERVGLKWGGRWRKPDLPHFELPGVCSFGLRLEARDRQLQRGASGPPTEELQARLLTAGFQPGPRDGHYGPRTEGAVKSLQSWMDLKVTGAVSVETIEALERVLAQEVGQD